MRTAGVGAPRCERVSGLTVGGLRGGPLDVINSGVDLRFRTDRGEATHRSTPAAQPRVLTAISKNLGVSADVLEQSRSCVCDPNLASAVQQTPQTDPAILAGSGGSAYLQDIDSRQLYLLAFSTTLPTGLEMAIGKSAGQRAAVVAAAEDCALQIPTTVKATTVAERGALNA